MDKDARAAFDDALDSAPARADRHRLREIERDLTEAHRIAKLGTWRWILATDTVIWSDEVYRIFGLNPALPAPSFAEHPGIIGPESCTRLNEAVARLLATGEPYELELEVPQPDGGAKWMSVRGEADGYEDGKVARLRGTVREITQRKRAEAALALSEARNRALAQTSASIIWVAGPNGASMSELVEWRKFTGQSLEEATGYGWADAIHPDDRDKSLRAWEQALRTGDIYEFEHRLRRHDGVYRHMSVRAAPVRDASGRIAEWIGKHTDITEKKLAADLQRRAEFVNLAELAIASSPAATIVMDPDGVITFLNPAAERLLVYAKEDLVGRHTPLLFLDRPSLARYAASPGPAPGEAIPAGLAALTGMLNRGKPQELELPIRRGDQSWFEARLSVSPLRYPSGDFGGLILVVTDVTEAKRNAEHIYHLAHHDPLTGLPSRRLLQQRLEAALRHRALDHGRLAVLMVDLDNFKHVNDLMGHKAGDELIMRAAERLKRSLRHCDTVARVGGDEFIVLLDRVQSQAAAERVARKLNEALRAPIKLGGTDVTAAASIGISLYPNSGLTAEALLKNADAAMYRVKAQGGNNWKAFTEELAASLSRKRQVEIALKEALSRGELRLLYQPQLSLATGKVTGVEALLRWSSEALGTVAPAEFIPAAENCGLIVPIGEWVLRTACDQGRALQTMLGRDLMVAVNISPRQFEERDFLKTLSHCLAVSGLPADSLELEITENLLVRETSRALNVIRAARARGVHVAIDDFCTGFCSLSYITRFPVDRLKIDRSFVANMNTQAGGPVIAAIIALAHSLKISAVAEGIETVAQHDRLREMGCGTGQGFWYARPMPLEDLPARIAELEGTAAALVA